MANAKLLREQAAYTEHRDCSQLVKWKWGKVGNDLVLAQRLVGAVGSFPRKTSTVQKNWSSPKSRDLLLISQSIKSISPWRN